MSVGTTVLSSPHNGQFVPWLHPAGVRREGGSADEVGAMEDTQATQPLARSRGEQGDKHSLEGGGRGGEVIDCLHLFTHATASYREQLWTSSWASAPVTDWDAQHAHGW